MKRHSDYHVTIGYSAEYILCSLTAAAPIHKTAAPDRMGNARVIHPTTKMLSIAGSPCIAVNEM